MKYACKVCGKEFETYRARNGHHKCAHDNPMNNPEIRAKISGENSSNKRPEVNIKKSLALKGKPHPWCTGENSPMKRPEVRAKVSKAQKGRLQPETKGDNNPSKRPEVRAKLSAVRKGFKWSPEIKAKISKSHKGKKCPWISERNKINNPMLNPTIASLALQRRLQSNLIKPNKKEIQLKSLLDEIDLGNWEFVGDGKVVLHGYCPDFININGKKLIIELFGNYWHNKEGAKEKDERRLKTYESFGYKTLIIWESELNNSDITKNKILRFIKEDKNV